MVEFDQSITWRELEARLAKTTDPRHRKMIATVIEHGRAEAAADVDRLMATLSSNPEYHFWVDGCDLGPKGSDAVKAYYEGFVASGGAFFESYKPRIVIDDHNVVTENILRQIIPAALAARRGYQVPDPDGHYIVVTRVVNFWPFSEAGELTGEDAFSTSDMTVFKQVPENELPPGYIRMLELIGARQPVG
jgi:hypothetical protein